MDSLGDLLLMPWFSNPTFASFREDVSHLLEAMQRYHGFLMQQQNRTASNHRSSEPVRAYDDSWTWKDFEARKDEIPDEYLGLEQHVSTKELYEPECLDDFEPLPWWLWTLFDLFTWTKFLVLFLEKCFNLFRIFHILGVLLEEPHSYTSLGKWIFRYTFLLIHKEEGHQKHQALFKMSNFIFELK